MKASNRDSLFHYMINTRRYRILLQSLMVLSFLVLAFVTANFYIARYTTQSAEHMDLIGNISDLTLKIASETQHLAISDSKDAFAKDQVIQNLQKQADELDNYMTKLSNYEKHETAMDQFAVIWKDYRRRIALLSNEDTQGKLELANYAYENQAKIWNLTCRSYEIYLHDTYRMADYSRYLTFVGFICLIAYILFFINYTIKQMYRDDVLLDKTQNDMRDIMNTVKEGLFLIDENMVIGNNYSKKLETLLGRQQIGGITLPKLLENMVSEKEIAATQLFINYLYESDVDEDLIQDINPLKKVEIIFLDEKGFTNSKYLHFDFLRVVNARHKKTINLFVSVVDITESMQLRQQIQKMQVDYHSFTSRAVYLLSLDQQSILQFIAQKNAIVASIKETLNKRVLDKDQLIAKVKTLLIETEDLVDTSKTLGLKQYDDLVSHLIHELKCLTRLCDIQIKDFSNFTIILDQYQNLLKLIEHLVNKQTWQP